MPSYVSSQEGYKVQFNVAYRVGTRLYYIVGAPDSRMATRARVRVDKERFMIGPEEYTDGISADVVIKARMMGAVSKALASLDMLGSVMRGLRFSLVRAEVGPYETHLYVQFDKGVRGSCNWEQYLSVQYGIDADVVVSQLWNGTERGQTLTAHYGTKYLGRFNPDTGRGTVILWNELIGG